MFQFKQFSIKQEFATMKVNTDGVLLGAWVDMSGAETALDIGTGTGVIALQMGQKNEHVLIDAIEMDEKATEEARFNFENSPFAKRLSGIHTRLQAFRSEKKYDVIVSNPPYFIDDLKPENKQKLTAKHTTSLSYEDLIFYAANHLTSNGRLYIAIPAFNAGLFCTLANAEGLFLSQHCHVSARTEKPAYLSLLCFEKTKTTCQESTLIIQNSNNTFTKEYIALTKDFYLKMA